MVREDLINSAVTFLQDPSVASSAPEQRQAFLRSKNLTQEEIDIALARAGDRAPAVSPPQGYDYPPPQYRQPQNYGYNPYGNQPWGAQQPPRRDWRDWFIMATVSTGVTYTLYTVAKRYFLPLIAPPTQPQLEQDKAQVDESFAKAFALIEQLSADTAALKTAEEDRTMKLDSTLSDVEKVISDLRSANFTREDQARRLNKEVDELRELIPRALENWKADGDAKIKELSAELKSLRMLLSNRLAAPAAQAPQTQTSSTPTTNGASRGGYAPPIPATADQISPASPAGYSSPSGMTSARGQAGSPFNIDGRRSIPAWQKAATTKAAPPASVESESPAPPAAAAVTEEGSA